MNERELIEHNPLAFLADASGGLTLWLLARSARSLLALGRAGRRLESWLIARRYLELREGGR